MDATIVIPAYNEEQYISEVLERITSQLNPQIIAEIIVVDNGSTDSTAHLAAQWPKTTVIKLEKTTISRARNQGAKHGKGRLLCFIDADVLVTKQWCTEIEKLVSTSTSENLLTGNPYAIRDTPSIIEKAWFGPLAEQQKSYLSGGNIVISKSAFEKIGGFDENLRTGEDYDFCMRAKNLGIQIALNPSLKAIHLGFPSDIKNFFRREKWHGMGDFQSATRFFSSKIALASTLFVALASLSALSLLAGKAGLAITLLVAALGLATAFTTYKFKGKEKKYLPVQIFLSGTYLTARGLAWLKRTS